MAESKKDAIMSISSNGDSCILLPDHNYLLDNQFQVTVLFIVEKWMEPDRRSVMEVTMALGTPKKKEQITITSDKPVVIWRNYEIKYIGGWRDEVQLKIRSTD